MKTTFLLKIKQYVFLILLASLSVSPSLAQSFSMGADVVSRYVWRGTDFGESLTLQPALTFAKGGFEVGAWASYAISPSSANVNENDLWAGYTFETAAAGSFSVGVTDYYFPTPDGPGFFDPDAHYIEPYLAYSGPEKLPITLMGGMFVHNDPDNSIYLQASLPIKVDGVELGLTLGGVTAKSDFYATDKAAIVNMGISATKTIPITDRFALPVSVGYILNPNTERSFLVFGLSI